MFRKSDHFLLLGAFISFELSVPLWFVHSRDAGIFVGLWVPSILSFGAFVRATLGRS